MAVAEMGPRVGWKKLSPSDACRLYSSSSIERGVGWKTAAEFSAGFQVIVGLVWADWPLAPNSRGKLDGGCWMGGIKMGWKTSGGFAGKFIVGTDWTSALNGRGKMGSDCWVEGIRGTDWPSAPNGRGCISDNMAGASGIVVLSLGLSSVFFSIQCPSITFFGGLYPH
jgi:hypothetical protein